MDPGRYGHQPRWENTSASEGYGGVHDRRDDGAYDLRRLLEDRHTRGPNQDIVDRENYPPPPATDLWQQSRRGSYEDEYSRQPEKPYEDSYHEMDSFREANKYNDVDRFHGYDKFRDSRSIDDYHDHEFDRPARYGARRHDDYPYDDYGYRSRFSHHDRDDSRERDYGYSSHGYDSDHERSGRRGGSWKKSDSRDRERDNRDVSRERDHSPCRKQRQSRSRSHSYDDRPRSRSPRSRSRSHGRSYREDSYEDITHVRNEKRREREDRRQHEHYSVAPSATVVVKGLSLKTTEENLYQILAEWGPLRHVRVIKERNSGISRGFAFIDFPSVDAAQSMMIKLGDEGLVVDGRKLFFEYSKPTGGGSGTYGPDGGSWSGHTHHKGVTVASDWMCIICGCVNFARRTSCFQCNEPRTDDAPPADIGSSNPAHFGKRGEVGPTHVLVVRGLDDNADEDMLRYEFAKHAPIKDLRLVRDKFTHVSRGFAFVHFYSVEDATKALEATNGMTLERNGQILRVAYAKSIMGPGSGSSGAGQSSSLAAAAIEAATFAQQYDAVGWAPKEYNPDAKQADEPPEQDGEAANQNSTSAPQSGFVWDEASGYYYDAASGFYYDGNTGLYYDGNNGIWYTYDNQSQQYVPCTDQKGNTSEKQADVGKPSDGSNVKKVVISAPAATISSSEKAASLPDAVQAAAAAAIAAEKKEKEKAKEIKLASKSSLLASKKKMSNVLTMWKQRNHEGQQPRVALDGNPPSVFIENKSNSAGLSSKNKFKSEALMRPDNSVVTSVSSAQLDSQERRPVSNSSGGTVSGVIRSSGLGVVKSDTLYVGPSSSTPTSSHIATSAALSSSMENADVSSNLASYRTNSSALGSYAPTASAGTGKRRFSELPQQPASASQMTYRDRAAERRNLYGSTSSLGDDLSEHGEPSRDSSFRRSAVDSMPFPPGVGGGRGSGDAVSENFEVITADKAIDEHNVGNRMLRSMGWQEGSGLGKDGSGVVEPVQAQGTESRAGLGIHQPKKSDPDLEVQAGDSYKNIIQKKAIARFREMS
ncbi:hypothetical protein Leryth_022184 [Lithospermum erythrorhizon]|nr:hypothetical protein Leryth_022184 [Lithospermum erythrorhizon]